MAIREFASTTGKVRMGTVGVTYGVFDLCHAGHYYFLKKCREQCDYLIVCLESDPTLERPYKNKPIQSIEERRIALEHNRYVDEVVEFDTQNDLFVYLQQNVELISIRFSESYWIGKRYVGDKLPIQIVFIDRVGVHSTTDLRQRVLDSKK